MMFRWYIWVIFILSGIILILLLARKNGGNDGDGGDKKDKKGGGFLASIRNELAELADMAQTRRVIPEQHSPPRYNNPPGYSNPPGYTPPAGYSNPSGYTPPAGYSNPTGYNNSINHNQVPLSGTPPGNYNQVTPSTQTSRLSFIPTKPKSVILDYTPVDKEGPRRQQNGFVSRGEEISRQALEKIYQRQFDKIRPDWLINPKTGCRLELDGYNEELKIGFEYNGIQHYVYPNIFHKTEEEFNYQLYKDRVKSYMCDEQGIWLIRIPYTVKYHQIEDYIKGKLPPQEHFKRTQKVLTEEMFLENRLNGV